MTNFKNALAENREFIQSLNDKEFWGVVQKEAPTDMGRYVAPAKRGNLQEMIYLGATFLLATNALPRNIAIALRLLQKGLELGNEDARFFKNMSQRLIDEHLEAEDAATGQLA